MKHKQQQQPSIFCLINIGNLLRLLAPHQSGNLLPDIDIQEFVIHYWRKVRSCEFIKGQFTSNVCVWVACKFYLLNAHISYKHYYLWPQIPFLKMQLWCLYTLFGIVITVASSSPVKRTLCNFGWILKCKAISIRTLTLSVQASSSMVFTLNLVELNLRP